MGKAEGEVYHLTEAEVSKREEMIGLQRDFQIEEGRIRGIVWMLQLLLITLASLTPTPYSPKISGFRNSIRMNKEHHCLLFYHSNCDNQKVILFFFWLYCLNITKFTLHFCLKVASLLFWARLFVQRWRSSIGTAISPCLMFCLKKKWSCLRKST